MPRALYRDVAGPDQHAYVGFSYRRGVHYDGKGTFDASLLCSRHESSLGDADDYGVSFLRRFNHDGTVSSNGRRWLVPNPRPDLLLKFAAACVWRRGVSQVRRDRSSVELGPWEPKLRNFVFGGAGDYQPQLSLLRQELLLDGQSLAHPVLVEPERLAAGRRCFAFRYGACYLVLVVDDRQLRRTLAPAAANGENPAPALLLSAIDWTVEPAFVQIVRNMGLDPETRPTNPVT